MSTDFKLSRANSEAARVSADLRRKMEDRRKVLAQDLSRRTFDECGYPRAGVAVPDRITSTNAFLLACDGCGESHTVGGMIARASEDDFEWIMHHSPRFPESSTPTRAGEAHDQLEAEDLMLSDFAYKLRYLGPLHLFQALTVDSVDHHADASWEEVPMRRAAAELRAWNRGWWALEWFPKCRADLLQWGSFDEDVSCANLLREPARSVLLGGGPFLQVVARLCLADVQRARALWLADTNPPPTPVRPYVRLCRFGLLPLPVPAGANPRFLSLRGWLRAP